MFRFDRLLKKLKKMNTIILVGMFLLTITLCEAEETTKVACDNLHQVKDIDDLLLQFYNNIDNQCLFDMPTQELERIWGIRVLDYMGLTTAERYKLNREYDRIQENEDNFFISKKQIDGIVALDISLTNHYRDKYKGWGGSMRDGIYPKLLPMPTITNEPYYNTDLSYLGHIYRPWIASETFYREYSKYYWVNKLHSTNQPLLVIRTREYPTPLLVTLYSEAKIIDPKNETKPIAKGNCQQLTKVRDIDDLIVQFYNNMDSQCLFEMPTKELERVWGIRIIEYLKVPADKSEEYSLELYYELRAIREKGDGFFLIKNDSTLGIPYFDINLTIKYLEEYRGWGGSIGKGQTPMQLSAPVVRNRAFTNIVRGSDYFPGPSKDIVFRVYSQYYWINKAKSDNLPMLFMFTDYGYTPSAIKFYAQTRLLDFNKL